MLHESNIHRILAPLAPPPVGILSLDMGACLSSILYLFEYATAASGGSKLPGQPPPARVYYHHMCTETDNNCRRGHSLSDICSVDLLTAGRRISLWGKRHIPRCQAAAVSIQPFLIIPRSFAATPGSCVLLALPGRLVSHTTRAVVL